MLQRPSDAGADIDSNTESGIGSVIESDPESPKNQPGFDRIYRESVDMQIAITTHAKLVELQAAQEAQMAREAQEAQEAREAQEAQMAQEAQEAEQPTRSFKGRLLHLSKRMARPFVLPIYLGAKPLLRPLTRRIRRNLLESFQLETRAAHAQTQQQIAANHDQIYRHILASEQALTAVFARLDTIEQYAAAAARRVAIECGPDEVLVRTEVGYVVCSKADQTLLALLLESGDLERGTRLLIERFLEPGNTFVDVGANIGLHALAAARTMHGVGQIIAFEPFEPTMRLLRKSMFIGGFSTMLEAHQAAVSDHTGAQTLYLGKTSGHHSLYPLGANYPHFSTPEANTEAVETPIVTLDSVIASSVRADLIKIDVEGAELEVIAGAHSVIERNPDIALIVEFGTSHLTRTGHTAADWIASFERLGFVYRVIGPQTGVLEEWSFERLEQVESANLFFARPNSNTWEKAQIE